MGVQVWELSFVIASQSLAKASPPSNSHYENCCFSFLLLSHRLLSPGLPLNGTENTPAMRVLGSPKTLTELDCNYRKLIKREHPDLSIFPQAVAVKRFKYLQSLYRITRENWDKLKPTAVITKEQLEVRMNANLPYDPDSFWLA